MSSQKTKEAQIDGGQARRIIDAKWDGRSSFTLPEVAEILGICAWNAYEAAKRGDIPVITIGKRKIVPRVQLERLMTGA